MSDAITPLRVVPPPAVLMTPGPNAPAGTKTRAALLEPLSMRERAMVSAIAEALEAFNGATNLDPVQREGLLLLLVAFKDGTGCAYHEAEWFDRVK
jgi:hypothetical protein